MDGIRRFDGEGMEVDDQVFKVPEVPMPRHVTTATEGTVFKLRKSTDILVLAITQKFDCSQCEAMLLAFANTSMAFANRPKEEVRFAVLDAVEEADEFSYLSDENPDFHWFVPAVLIFKKEYQQIYRRPPISHVINERLAHDLPRFVDRIIGQDAPAVETEEALLKRIHSDSTEGVSFAIWPGTVHAESALLRLVETERLQTFWSYVTPALAKEADVASRLNPNGHTLVAYIARDKAGLQIKSIDLNKLPHDFSAQIHEIRKFVEEMKTNRPGHAYDLLNAIKVETLEKPEHCRHVDELDKIILSMTGTNLMTGLKFLTIDQEKLSSPELPADRGDLPSYFIKKGFVGYCDGEKRRVILPPMKHYAKNKTPPDVETDDRLQFDVEVQIVERPVMQAGGDVPFEDPELPPYQRGDPDDGKIRSVKEDL